MDERSGNTGGRKSTTYINLEREWIRVHIAVDVKTHKLLAITNGCRSEIYIDL